MLIETLLGYACVNKFGAKVFYITVLGADHAIVVKEHLSTTGVVQGRGQPGCMPRAHHVEGHRNESPVVHSVLGPMPQLTVYLQLQLFFILPSLANPVFFNLLQNSEGGRGRFCTNHFLYQLLCAIASHSEHARGRAHVGG